MAHTLQATTACLLVGFILSNAVNAKEPTPTDSAFASATTNHAQPSKHTFGYGVTNGLLGYRYTFNTDRYRPFLTLGATVVGLGLEHIPKHSIHHAFEYTVGASAFGEMVGAKWMWHVKGPLNKGLAVGIGPTYIKNFHFFIFESEEKDSLSFIDLSINWKF